MINIFLIANLAVVLTYCAWRSRGLRLNHVSMFSFGFIAYWIFPVILARIATLEAVNDAYQRWYGLFNRVPEAKLLTYLQVTLLIYCGFVLGDMVGLFIRRPDGRAENVPNLRYFIYPGIWITLAVIFLNRAALFGEYGENTLRGTLTAMSLFIFASALVGTIPSDCLTFFSLLRNRFMLGYFVLAFLILLMGERLYFVTTLLMLTVYRSCFVRVIKVKQLLIGALLVLSLASIIGLSRLGESEYAIETAVVHVAAEPAFTSFSLMAFLRDFRPVAFRFPKYLMGDMVNLVPSALIPNKAAMLPDPASDGFEIFMPLGALNSFVSWQINFGVMGSFLMAFCLGFFLNWLRAGAGQLRRCVYSMLSGCLAFTFFRDAFAISVVKNMLEASILFPVGAYAMSGILRRIALAIRFRSSEPLYARSGA